VIRLTCCHRPNHAGEYFRLQLQGGDASSAPILVPLALQAEWVGSALPLVGLSSFVPPSASCLIRLAKGRHPVEKTQLAPTVNRTRAYYDIVIAAPKTVSLAALLQPDHPVAGKVMKAHSLAVHRVAEEVGQWMIRGQSRSAPRVAKWLGVIFGHTHTREGDPHMHSHLVVPNLMLNQEGQWRALQIDIANQNRLRLGLLYGHELSRNLRQAGLGEELWMRPNALPELRSLRPMARTFSLARAGVLQAHKAAEAKRPAQDGQGGKTSEILPLYPERSDRAALKRRQQLADRLRQRKPRLADDPVSLDYEARRWIDALAKDQLLTLLRVLKSGDKRPENWRALSENVPCLDKAFVRDACRSLSEDTRRTGPIVFQATVRVSAGQHSWEELRRVCREYLEARKKRWQKICDDTNSRATQVEWARLARPTLQARFPGMSSPERVHHASRMSR
jgi:hypothetical protein